MSSGQSFAHYTMGPMIGAGGMGEVFRATDSKLNRDVALKMLPDTLIDNAERLARFQREAQVLAQLNHHGIAAIYGLESEGSCHALAMELVEGPDLSEKLASGPLPVSEALDVALQLAEAVEAAHEKGIVHRDLKPANIKITPEGRVKVLDFGLAKALADDPTDGGVDPAMSPTLTANMTMGNVILGTAAYMSPEQARGTEVDKRSDIWAFGVVLVEMLGGKRLFAGETVSDTLASVLQASIDFDDLPEDLPREVKRLIRRCLQRDPRQRLRDIGDARIILQDVLGGDAEDETVVAIASGGRWPAQALVAVITLALVAAIGAWFLKPGPVPTVKKLDIGINAASRIDPGKSGVAISPDGTQLAYMQDDVLLVRNLDQTQAREIPGSDGAAAPTWSPDGAWLAFTIEKQIWKVPAEGGMPIKVGETTGAVGPAGTLAWATDDRILFVTGGGGLFAIPAAGGRESAALDVDKDVEQDFHHVSPLPNGRGVIFVNHRLEDGVCALSVWDGQEKKQVLHLPGEYLKHPVYAPSGHIVYTLGESQTSIWAVPFSLDRLEVTGERFLVAQEGTTPRVSGEGTLVYFMGTRSGWSYEAILVDRQGSLLRTMGTADNIWPFPALFPDGRDAVLPTQSEGRWDLWVFDSRGATIRLTDDNADEDCPVVTDDGRWIYFGSGNAGDWKIRRVAVDGTGETLTLPLEQAPPAYYGSALWVSPDGNLLLYSSKSDETGQDISSFRLNEEGATPESLIATAADELAASLSPDGEHVLYMSDLSGHHEIYLARYPSGTGRRQVSTGGGAWPRWKGDGSEVYYVAGDSMMAVEVELGTRLLLGPPRGLFAVGPTTHSVNPSGLMSFDVSDDGENFLYIRRLEPESGDVEDKRIVRIENWHLEYQ